MELPQNAMCKQEKLDAPNPRDTQRILSESVRTRKMNFSGDPMRKDRLEAPSLAGTIER